MGAADSGPGLAAGAKLSRIVTRNLEVAGEPLHGDGHPARAAGPDAAVQLAVITAYFP